MIMKKGRGELRGIVKIALVASVLMIGLTPLANAVITITITPEICNSCQMTNYIVQVTSDTPWHWQNTTIPAGISILQPTTGGEQLVRTDFWNNSVYVGNVIIKSNTADFSGHVDVTATIYPGPDTATNTQPISYGPGDTFTINSPLPGGTSMLQVRWPTATEEGYANVSIPGLLLQNITDNYTLALCCPEPGAMSWFHATAESDPVGDSASVTCSPLEVPVYNTVGMATLVGIMSVVLGFAAMRRKK
jgi:hypothetical protein